MIPYKGEVLLHGEKELRKNRKNHLKQVNYCEAEPRFPTFITGAYLLDMYAKLKGGDDVHIQQVRDILGIGEYIDQQIGSYSSGMKKKLALLLAFTGNPDLILLDEPFNTLDKDAQQGLRQLILTYHLSGSSFILATHQASTLEEISVDCIWKISDHQIQKTFPQKQMETTEFTEN